MQQGLDRILEAADANDIRLDAIGYVGQLQGPALVGVARVLMDAGRGELSGSDALDSLRQYRISGVPMYPGQAGYDPAASGQPYLQTPGLQEATSQFLQGLPHGQGMVDRQMAEAIRRAQGAQQQGLIPQPAAGQAPPAAPAGPTTWGETWGKDLDSLLGQ